MSPPRPAKPLSFSSHLAQLFPPASNFSPDSLPPLPGIRALVTGGSSGIGIETARALLRAGASVVLMSRGEEKSRRVVRELEAEGFEGRVRWIQLDLGDLRSVTRAAEEYTHAFDTLHLLINNGGVMHPGKTAALARSAQGHDVQLATNALGHYHLTLCLLPVLVRTTYTVPGAAADAAAVIGMGVPPSPSTSTCSLPSLTNSADDSPFSSTEDAHLTRSRPAVLSPEQEAALLIGVRVLTLASNVHHFAPPETLAWQTFAPSGATSSSAVAAWAHDERVQDVARRKMGGLGLYAQSKMANVLVSNYLSRTLAHTGIVFVAIHPGGIKTALTRGAPKWQNAITNWILYPPTYGALTSLWAATCEDRHALNGKYCIPWARVGAPRADGEDMDVAQRLANVFDRMREGY